MPRLAILEIRFKTQTLLPCKEKRVGMSDDDAIRRSAELLVEIGRNIRNAHKNNLGRQYPPSSSPGQYPARRTGSLKNGIYHDPEKPDRIIRARDRRVRIGYSNKNSKQGKNPYSYGPDLVRNMARLGIIETMNRNTQLLNNPWKPVIFNVIQVG